MAIGHSIVRKIDYLSVDADLSASFAGLCRFLQEAATEHTNSTHYPMEWYAENARGWLVCDFAIEARHYPKYGDNVRIETFPTMFRGYFAERSFTVRDESGGLLMEADSRWVFTDLTKRAVAKAPDFLILDYGGLGEPRFANKRHMPKAEEFEPLREISFPVFRRELDSNGHVNNSKYIEWASDLIPDEVYDSREIKTALISYRKECVLNDRIRVACLRSRENAAAFKFTISKEDAGGGLERAAEVAIELA